MKNNGELDYVRDLPGYDRGNPMYFENEVIDHLVSIVLELGAEMWVLKDRQAFLEELLSKEGKMSLEVLDKSRPSDELQGRLSKERKDFIRRIYGRLYSKYGGDKADFKVAPTNM
jgi:hypothetical protein